MLTFCLPFDQGELITISALGFALVVTLVTIRISILSRPESKSRIDMFSDHVLTFCNRSQSSGSLFIFSMLLALFGPFLKDLLGLDQRRIEYASYFCLLIGFLLFTYYWVHYVFWYRFMIYLKTISPTVKDKDDRDKEDKDEN